MSPRAFLALSAAAIAALVIAIALILVQPESGIDRPSAGELMFPTFADRVDDLARVELETANYDLALEQRGGSWVATSFGDYPVEADPLVQIITSLASMSKVEPKTSNPDWYNFIDVNDPEDPESPESVHVTAIATDGDVLLDAYIGMRSASIGFSRFGGTFVREVDDEQAWLVEGVIAPPTFLQDWFDSLFGIPGPDIASVTIYKGDELMFSAEKVDFETADYVLTDLSETIAPADSDVQADDARIRSLSQGIVSTIFDSARSLDSISFTQDDRVIVFVTRAGLELTVRLTAVDDTTWVTYSASAPEDSEAAATAAEINAKTERWAFQIPSYRVDSLSRPVDELVTFPVEEAPPADLGLPGLVVPGQQGIVPGQQGIVPSP